jgi:hypothetical protein
VDTGQSDFFCLSSKNDIIGTHKRGRRKKEVIKGNGNENRNKKEDCRKVGAKIARK